MVLWRHRLSTKGKLSHVYSRLTSLAVIAEYKLEVLLEVVVPFLLHCSYFSDVHMLPLVVMNMSVNVFSIPAEWLWREINYHRLKHLAQTIYSENL